MQKRNFESYQKCFKDFEIVPKFSETHVFRGTIRHHLDWVGEGAAMQFEKDQCFFKLHF